MSFFLVFNDQFVHTAIHSPVINDQFGHKAIFILKQKIPKILLNLKKPCNKSCFSISFQERHTDRQKEGGKREIVRETEIYRERNREIESHRDREIENERHTDTLGTGSCRFERQRQIDRARKRKSEKAREKHRDKEMQRKRYMQTGQRETERERERERYIYMHYTPQFADRSEG